MTTPSRQEIRDALANSFRRNEARAWSTAVFDVGCFGLAAFIAASPGHPALRLLAAGAEAVFMARLFILGHDACHGSAFGGPRARAIAGRIFFLPTLTPYSTWQIGHNSVHHGYSNLKGRDSVWAPYTPAEFGALPLARRVAEFIYRSAAGQGLYYLVALWWKELFFPRWRHKSRVSYTTDSWMAAAFGASMIGTVYSLGARVAGGSMAEGLWAVAWAWVLPFALWNQLMGLVIYVQHTHPETRWFRDRASWGFVAAQMDSTVQAGLPLGLHHVLHGILEHTAHHVDVSIPFYGLHRAQARLEAAFGDRIVRQRWSWRAFFRTTRVCKLYDFDREEWVGFEAAKCPIGAGARLVSRQRGSG